MSVTAWATPPPVHGAAPDFRLTDQRGQTVTAASLRGAPWIGWIHDLSVQDPLYILPALMTASTLFQTWLNPTPPDPTPTPTPTPVVLTDEPQTMSAAKVELGRHLFYDRRLSGNGSQSCASCHLQHKAFTDGLALAQGSTGQFHRRGAQPLANVTYNATLTWANPSLVTLEKQMEVPLFGDDPVEMGVND